MTNNPRQAYFNNLAAEWDTIPGPPDASERVRRFVERSECRAALRVLDVGCGTGILVPAVLDFCRDTSFLVELDLAHAMLKVNSDGFPDRRVVRVCADAQTVPFAGGSFDLVLCFGVLPHLDDQAGAIKEFLRVLRRGGIFCSGHLMGSRELNEFHRNLQGPVSADTLPAADALARLIGGLGGTNLCAEESQEWYFVRAVKS